MDVLTSSEFRKRYATLTDRTEVTVNGHVIGTWVPTGAPVRVMDPPRLVSDEDVVDFALGTPAQQTGAAERIAQGKPGITTVGGSFGSSRPAPKPSVHRRDEG